MTAETDYAPALEQALRHSLNHLDKAKDGPVGAAATLAQLRARLGRPLAEDGTEPAHVIDELVRDVEGGIVNNACGRFFGWVIGGTLPAAVAADWLRRLEKEGDGWVAYRRSGMECRITSSS